MPAFGQEVEEVPEAGFQVGPQRVHRAADVLDEVAVDRDESGDSFGPDGRRDAGRATAPVVSGEDRARDGEGVHQGDDVGSEGALLPGPGSIPTEEAGGAVPA